MHKVVLLTIIVLAGTTRNFSQSDSASAINYGNRKLLLASSTGVLTVGSLVGLHQIWYSQYNTGTFHYFNDGQEWLQMDKVGHAYTTYQAARLMMDAFAWAGYSEKQKLFIGGSIGFAYMTAIELMDGFSEGWGYSWYDQLANFAGTAAAIAQEGLWKEQRIQFKFSYARSGLAQYNPNLLGDSPASRLIKDYNAQTYWLSVNPSAFLAKSSRFPKWLNLAFGYSAYGMLGGHYNNVLAQNEAGYVYKVERERRFYLSLDVDLCRIKTRSKVLKTLFSVINILKFPAPALQFNGNTWRFYGIYY